MIALHLINGIFAATPTADPCQQNSFFFFPHWWQYLKTGKDALGQCSIDFNFPADLLLVGLAILDIMIRLAGLLAVVGVLAGSLRYILALGNPEKIGGARKSIINALVGLAIATVATATVTFIGKQFGG